VELQSADGLNATGVVTMETIEEGGRERTRLNFAHAVRQRFAFLDDFGFSESESLPTLVRYRKGEVEVTLYHGRQSFELGFEISRDGGRYSMSELIGVADVEAAKRYRNYSTTTSAGVVEGLSQLAELVMRYGDRGIRVRCSRDAAATKSSGCIPAR
jgi:hypothetical protein